MPTRASVVNSVQKSCAILRSLTEALVRSLSEIAALSDHVSSRMGQLVDSLKGEAESVGSPKGSKKAVTVVTT
jgi:hypothetical protein